MRDNVGTVMDWVTTRDGTQFLGQRRIGEPGDLQMLIVNGRVVWRRVVSEAELDPPAGKDEESG